MLFAPFLLLHFLSILPEEKVRLRNSPLIYLIYILPLITLILYPLIGYANGQPSPAFRLVRIFEFGSALLAALIIAILNYIRATSPRTRQQMKIIFIGCIAALVPFLVFAVIPEFIFHRYFLPSEASLLLVAFIPLAMGYAIINQKLLDIDVFIRRSVVYGSITLIMAGILSIAIFFTLNLQESIGLSAELLIALALGGIATALLGPIKSGIETLIDKIFYKDRYDYRQIIQTLSNSLNLTNDATDASHLVVNTAVETMNLAGGSLFIKTETGSYQLMAARGVLTEIENRQIANLTSKLDKNTSFPNLASSLHEAHIAYIVPIAVGEKEIGLLFLSPKLSRQEFSYNDLYLIQSLVSVASVSLLRMLADAHAIMERKQAEEAIIRAAEEWRATFDSIDDMIATIDSNNLILRVNKAFSDAVGIPPQELIGKHCYEIIHNSSTPYALCPHIKTIKTRKTESSEFFESTLGKYIEVTTSPIFDPKQNFIGSVHVIKDQTARKQAQAEQQRLQEKAEISSRLAAVGEMAAGVAHEVNNPLTGVIGFSQLLAERQDLPQDAKEEVKVIADCSQRVADIVKKLLTFARQSKPVQTSTNLNHLIDNTLKLRSYVLSTANIEVTTHLDPDLPSIVIDSGQIQQVFLNLIINAEYALKKINYKGTLTITTEKVDKHIRIIFHDNGPGITPNNLKRIFEPFFTTKPLGEGTGLGLSLSRSIILEHNGEMLVESAPGDGATFTILLPISDKLPEPASTPSVTDRPKSVEQKKARILVVDDEITIRKYLTIALTKLGHEVDSTASPDETIAKLQHSIYDLVFLDIRLPGMSGITLYEKIKEQVPQIANRVIIITGDTSSADVKYFLKQYGLDSISKPFDQQTLEGKVNEMLQRMS
jgi:PAS domain S-box-containing protein